MKLLKSDLTLAEAVKLCLEDREHRAFKDIAQTVGYVDGVGFVRCQDDTGYFPFLTDDILGITKFNVYQTEGIEG